MPAGSPSSPPGGRGGQVKGGACFETTTRTSVLLRLPTVESGSQLSHPVCMALNDCWGRHEEAGLACELRSVRTDLGAGGLLGRLRCRPGTEQVNAILNPVSWTGPRSPRSPHLDEAVWCGSPGCRGKRSRSLERGFPGFVFDGHVTGPALCRARRNPRCRSRVRSRRLRPFVRR